VSDNRRQGVARRARAPNQTVRHIEVDFDQDPPDDKVTKNTPAYFQASFGFMLKRSNEWYGEELVCKVASDHFDCYLEADGGKFRLTPEGDGLRLEVTGGGGGTDQIVAEGTDWGTFGGPGSDDRVFILRRADRKLCDAASRIELGTPASTCRSMTLGPRRG
jgi:hypothetical protein